MHNLDMCFKPLLLLVLAITPRAFVQLALHACIQFCNSFRGVLAFLDMSVYKISTKLEDRISELDDCESVFHATARDTRDYAKYRRLVQVMRVQLAVCKVQPRRKRSLSKWVSRTVTRAERIV